MILEDMVKALKRLDEKLGVIADALGPLSAEVTRLKAERQIDRNTLNALGVDVQGIRGLEAQSRAHYADGLLNYRAKKNPDDDDAKRHVQEVKDLASVAKKDLQIIVGEIASKEISSVVGRINMLLQDSVDKRINQAEVLFRSSERTFSDAERRLRELEKQIEGGIEGMTAGKLDEAKGVFERGIAMLKEKLRQAEIKLDDRVVKLKDADKEVSETIKMLENLGGLYEDKIRSAVQMASVAAQKSYKEVKEKVERTMAEAEGKSMKLCDEMASKTEELVKEMSLRNHEEVGRVHRAFKEKEKQLNVLLDGLKELATKVDQRIIEAERSIATTNNSRPRNQRVRIQHGS